MTHARWRSFAKRRSNDRYLPGVPLPEAVLPTNDLQDCIPADMILFVTPSKAIRSVAETFSKLDVPAGTPLVSCTKGIEHETGLRMSQVLGHYFPGHPIGALSGPNHAEEVARRMPAAAVVAFADLRVAERLQPLLSTPWFRAYTTDDVAGVELGGALKNIYAIAAGVSDGLGFGDNSKAALETRALVELVRLGVVLGGRRETFFGLSGLGDLIVTCFSRHSRNRGLGERLGRGEPLDQITAAMSGIAEGVPTDSRRLRVRAPRECQHADYRPGVCHAVRGQTPAHRSGRVNEQGPAPGVRGKRPKGAK